MEFCAYCGVEPGVTRDHVPPYGFFPHPRPLDLITVPSCKACNGGYSQDEEYVRNVIAAGFRGTEESVGYQVFGDQVRRSLTRRKGVLLQRIAQNIRPADVHSSGGIYLGTLPSIQLEADRFARVMEKIARGLFYHESGRILGEAHVQVIDPDKAMRISALRAGLLQLAEQEQRGAHPEVFRYKFALSEQDPKKSAWLLQFYEGVTVAIVTAAPQLEGTGASR